MPFHGGTQGQIPVQPNLLQRLPCPGRAEESLIRRMELFEQCPAITTVFIPGGDPGNTPPEQLLPWLEKLSKILRECHPDAQLWLSNEDMAHEWNNDLFDYLKQEQPDWLDGIVYGTWTKLSLEDERLRPLSPEPEI